MYFKGDLYEKFSSLQVDGHFIVCINTTIVVCSIVLYFNFGKKLTFWNEP